MRPALILAITLALCVPTFLVEAKSKDRDKKATEETADESKLTASTFSGLELRSIGPALMSGRISDIAVDPRDQSAWYVAVGSGGVWKTLNAGSTWTPIFDDQGSYSIGCVTLDPSRPDTVWVGTGENVGGRHVGFGDGVYRSRDGGQSWENLGLKESGHIGTILVHPEDSNVVYVAAHGPLWVGGGERGLYKTVDGGANWTRLPVGATVATDETEGITEYTGVNEVVMDPRDPEVLYASTHQRFRNVAALINGGPGSAIHKSTDGGETWRELGGGLPAGDKGRIGLAISPQRPDVVYATVELAQREGGFYRSEDAGETWEKRSDYISGGTGPHYYQEIFASPHQFDRIYQMDARLHFTEDGGRNFSQVGEKDKHGDNHAMAFDPNDPDYLLVGSDGGLYQSWDLGKTWMFATNLPITQFYKVAVDNDEPFYNIYGGTQDNNSQGGPSRTLNVNGIRSSDWFITLFGDGHQSATDPSNPDIVYAEWQQGNLVRYDRKTGEIVYIQPQPDAGEPAERWNWDSPILVSPHDPARLYFASQRVWRSDDRGDSWKAISGDLSRNLDRLSLPMMGRVWSLDASWDLWAMSNYSTITSITESPLEEGLIYAGSDDGLIQVTEDGGQNWSKGGALPGVPKGAFVNDIKADLHDSNTVYVALDHHKSGDYRPFLLKSTDRGKTWTSIAGDPEEGGLPARHLVWRMVQDPVKADLLFAGTEFGIFFSLEGGNQWIELTGGVPQISFRDLAIQAREVDLVGASFGRGFFVFDDYSPLRQVDEAMISEGATLFPVKDADWYIPRRPLGRGEKATQGADFYVAPNPPFGAIFTYYLAEGLETRAQARKKAETKVAKEGGDTPYPGWDALRDEAKEDMPAMVLTVRDSEGGLVRRLEGPTGAGFHRLAWDLRYPSTEAWSPRQGDDFFGGGSGVLAPPGTYNVSLSRRLNGEETSFGEKQTFEVVALGDTVLPRMDPKKTRELLGQVAELRRQASAAGAVMEATETRLGAMKDVLMRSSVEDVTALRAEIAGLEHRLGDLTLALEGDELKGGMGEPTAPSILGRLGTIGIGNAFSSYGPTPHHLRNLEIAEKEFAELKTALTTLVETDLRAIEAKLEAAGAPWTPGRGVP